MPRWSDTSPPEPRICPRCDAVGHSSCLLLNVIPSRVVVEERFAETVACPHDNMIVAAPVPPQIVERGGSQASAKAREETDRRRPVRAKSGPLLGAHSGTVHDRDTIRIRRRAGIDTRAP